MSYKRNQIEEAIARIFDPNCRKPPSEVRTRIKRLLELDRSRGRKVRSNDPEAGNFAFFSEEAPGTGADISFSEYEAFALLNGLRIIDRSSLPNCPSVRVHLGNLMASYRALRARGYSRAREARRLVGAEKVRAPPATRRSQNDAISACQSNALIGNLNLARDGRLVNRIRSFSTVGSIVFAFRSVFRCRVEPRIYDAKLE